MASLDINENGVDFKALQELGDLCAHLQAAQKLADNDQSWYQGGAKYDELKEYLKKAQYLYMLCVIDSAKCFIKMQDTMVMLGAKEQGIDFAKLQELGDLCAHLQAAKRLADNDQSWYQGGAKYDELNEYLKKVQDLYISAVSNNARSYIEKKELGDRFR